MLISQVEGDQIFSSFTHAIAGAKHRPKGVLVSYELFHELHKRDLIQLKLATLGGMPELEAFGAIIPFFNGDIYIHCDPINLPEGDTHFRLPPGL